MRIAIGADHNGIVLKKTLKEFLTDQGHQVDDMGSQGVNPVDFPDIAVRVTEKIIDNVSAHGILICGTGVGMAMVANKVPTIRAALCHDIASARQAREHNDANLLCLGGLIVGSGLAKEIVQTYLNAEFMGHRPGGERYARRVEKMALLDRKR
jgi:ribose 5-phosphate isomerase B